MKNFTITSATTLRQVRVALPSTRGIKTPSIEWIRSNLNGDQVLFSVDYPDGGLLFAFH